MNDKIYSLLRELDLDDKEANTYTYLVSKNKLTAYQISKDMRVHRSNCYNVLNRLLIKGFVSVLIIKNKKYYSANELEEVLGRIKNEEAILKTLMSEVNKLKPVEDTTVKYQATKNSFAQLNIKLYELAKNKKLSFFYMISNSPKLTTKSSLILDARILNDLSKLNVLDKVNKKAIWDKKFRNNKFMKQFDKLGENRFIDKLPNQATTFIYDDHVIFSFLNETDSFIEIKNKMISEEMKSYFEYLWHLSNK
jgi:sugar-specific transcriptional regulator TrmB